MGLKLRHIVLLFLSGPTLQPKIQVCSLFVLLKLLTDFQQKDLCLCQFYESGKSVGVLNPLYPRLFSRSREGRQISENFSTEPQTTYSTSARMLPVKPLIIVKSRPTTSQAEASGRASQLQHSRRRLLSSLTLSPLVDISPSPTDSLSHTHNSLLFSSLCFVTPTLLIGDLERTTNT